MTPKEALDNLVDRLAKKEYDEKGNLIRWENACEEEYKCLSALIAMMEKMCESGNVPDQSFSLDDRCFYDIVECNGRKIYNTGEMEEEFPTYRQILNRCVGKGRWNYGSYNIIAQDALRGVVLNYGNHDSGMVEVIGTTLGYA